MTQAATGERARVRADDNRLFWRFWTAATVSDSGTAMTTLAIPLLAVLTLRSSSFEVAVLAATADVAWLVIGLPAGVIVGRLPPRGTQVAMDLIRVTAVLSVPLAAALHVLHFAQLVFVELVIGFASVIFDVGNSAYLPAIVSDDQLARRNSVTSGSYSAVQMGGPSLAGLLVQLAGAPFCLVLDGVSYVVSAALLRSLPRLSVSAQSGDPALDGQPARSAAAQILDGLRHVLHDKVIRACTSAATLLCLTAGALTAITPVYLVRYLGTPAGLVGVLIAADGVGGVIGASVTTRLGRRFGSARAVVLAATCSGLSVPLLVLAGHGWGLIVFGAGSAGFAAGVTVLSILTRTHRQTTTPRKLLPCVMATVRFVSWGAFPIGALAVGGLSSAAGIRPALWFTCAPALLTPVALWLSPVRHLGDLADSADRLGAPSGSG
jgi:MFS family permease